MKLVVFSHKLVWQNPESTIGYATDGGFAFHMKAISEIFDETIVAVPLSSKRITEGEILFNGHNLSIWPLKNIKGSGFRRKLNYIPWLLKHIYIFNKLINYADAVHVPIPSDIGTLGMLLAKIKNKPLFVRHCGNWMVRKTTAEKFWFWFMERYAGGKNLMLATGMQDSPPSEKNQNIKWIFSSSLTIAEIGYLGKNLPVLNIRSPRLIIVCRMELEKGPGRFIEAISLLSHEYPGIHLDIVGDGPALVKFKKMVEDMNLINNVTFHGKINHEDVLKVLQSAHIFCYPTLASEGFPKVVLEALASGLPVIGTPISAISLLLKNGSGILLTNELPDTLAQGIRKLLNDPGNYSNMQNRALEASRDFSLENWRDIIKNHLQSSWGLSLR